MRIISVTFATKRQKKYAQLTFPKKVARLLGLKGRQYVRIVVRRARSGEILLDEKVQLRSGTEIYGEKIKPELVSMQGKELWIEAWRPHKK